MRQILFIIAAIAALSLTRSMVHADLIVHANFPAGFPGVLNVSIHETDEGLTSTGVFKIPSSGLHRFQVTDFTDHGNGEFMIIGNVISSTNGPDGDLVFILVTGDTVQAWVIFTDGSSSGAWVDFSGNIIDTTRED